VPSPRLTLPVDDPRLAAGLAEVRAQLEVPLQHGPEAVAEAEAAVRRGPLPSLAERADRRDLPFVTIDPPGSRDLDQAFAAARIPGGIRVFYAIADVASWVAPGGALDLEARRRAVTLYAPDTRALLYPAVLSEGAASLLPDGDRPALLWTLDLAADGTVQSKRVERATVRSREQLDYAEAQARIESGTADTSLALLRDVGLARLAQQDARGGVSLDLPEQQVEHDDGGYALTYRVPLPVEHWNAQVSLLTGMAAASLMLDARVGLLRTMPPPTPQTIAMLRKSAALLGVSWPDATTYNERASTLDPAQPAEAALMHQAARLFRGAGYVAFDGTVPSDPVHAAIAAPYAHVTAPLRRVGDRFVGEIALACCAGVAPPEWARAALPDLPKALERGDQRQHALDRAAIDLVEALLLQRSVGECFDAVVLDVDERRAIVQLRSPAVVTQIPPDGARPGTEVTLRLAEADPAAATLRFELAGVRNAGSGT
jgi:exoribonuclease R